MVFDFLFKNKSAKEINKKEITSEFTNEEVQDLSKYEKRSMILKKNNKTIKGIFYIYKDKLIPDFYSETLLFEENNHEMYHVDFFKNYLLKKYPELRRNHDCESVPRGRVAKFDFTKDIYVFIDKCYIDNKFIINQIIELYRLNENYKFVTNEMYMCNSCKEEGASIFEKIQVRKIR